MTQPAKAPKTPAEELFSEVLDVKAYSDQLDTIKAASAERDVANIARRLAYMAPELGELDAGVVRALYDLLPPIQQHIADRAEGKELPRLIQARMTHTPGAFMGAMLVASQAHGVPVEGFHGVIPVTATPDATIDQLQEQFRAATMPDPYVP